MPLDHIVQIIGKTRSKIYSITTHFHSEKGKKKNMLEEIHKDDIIKLMNENPQIELTNSVIVDALKEKHGLTFSRETVRRFRRNM